MKPPSSPEQLADAIESLVAAYVDEVRRAAREAIDRSLSMPAAMPKSRRSARTRSDRGGSSGKRRSAEELAEICEALHGLVCARPGEGLSAFADEMGLPLRALQRPMSKLKRDGRVRSVGERNMTRYFPAIGRRSRNANG